MILNNILSFPSKCNFAIVGRQYTAGKILYSKTQGSNKSPSKQSAKGNKGPPPSQSDIGDLSKVVGLSNTVINQAKGPVGPNASKDSDYKNPEYFCYHQASFYDAEIEMAKFRCPQPSVKEQVPPRKD